MKVGVITGYYSENSGTLLQAYSIGRVIEKMGHEVVYINTKNKYSSHSIKLMLGRFVKESLRGKMKNAKAAIVKYMNFSKSIKMYNVISLEEAKSYGIEKFVIGSDTVWNLEDKYFREAHVQYWPIIEGIETISYAAAVGNCKLSTMERYAYTKQCLNSMKYIAVRDNYSKSVIQELTDKKVEVVCDPTILIETKELEKFKRVLDVENKYILVYIFEELEPAIIDEIVKYAKQNELRIISLGKSFKWCDEQVVISVENFVSYYSQAAFVITNTFHGNVFSILFNRQFICAPCEKKKVIELLAEMGLEERRISTKDDFINAVNEQIDYVNVNNIIYGVREKSREYLENALNS